MNQSGALQQMVDAVVAKPSQQDQSTVRRFISLAVRGLVPMFDQQRQLFYFSLKKTSDGMMPDGISHRYTMMTLMGLHRLELGGGTLPFDREPILRALFQDLEWVNNIGDLGVLLWMCAVVCPERLAEVERRLQPLTALTRYRGVKRGITMEVAWFLTGLSYWAQFDSAKASTLAPSAEETYQLLIKNQGQQGFFGHLSTSKSLEGIARGRTGSFADQVYPIYAMAQYHKAFHNPEAASRARQCALGICEAQGPLGQWWWHYDVPGGRVTDGYPVFSVHQHAMAPMVLFGLGEVIGHDFSPWIYKGLGWINEKNELTFNMEDAEQNVIWRCIFRSRRSLSRYAKAGIGRYDADPQHNRPEDLAVLYECRPYELGWLLYAFANRIGRGEQSTEQKI
jgi:hypothetical protein